jgi:uncharacterized metal-binding protein
MARTIYPKSDGHFHGRITLVLAPVSFGVGFVLCSLYSRLHLGHVDSSAWLVAGAALFGCLAGLVIDPDLDQESMTTASEHRMRKLLSHIPLVGLFLWGAWMGWWSIYAAFHKHRGMSHWPILGTFVRVLWLSPLWYLLYHGNVIQQIPPVMLIAAFVGLAISDYGHWLRDYRGLKI